MLPVTAQSQSSTWISRRSKHRVWLRNIQLYVFCKNYRQEVQRQNKSNAFEIYFVTEQGLFPEEMDHALSAPLEFHS